jgi:hypothetical protein
MTPQWNEILPEVAQGMFLKVSKSQKQIIKSRILQKNTKHTQDSQTILSVFCLFFGRIKDIIICFRDLLKFRKGSR